MEPLRANGAFATYAETSRNRYEPTGLLWRAQLNFDGGSLSTHPSVWTDRQGADASLRYTGNSPSPSKWSRGETSIGCASDAALAPRASPFANSGPLGRRADAQGFGRRSSAPNGHVKNNGVGATSSLPYNDCQRYAMRCAVIHLRHLRLRPYYMGGQRLGPQVTPRALCSLR